DVATPTPVAYPTALAAPSNAIDSRPAYSTACAVNSRAITALNRCVPASWLPACVALPYSDYSHTHPHMLPALRFASRPEWRAGQPGTWNSPKYQHPRLASDRGVRLWALRDRGAEMESYGRLTNSGSRH